MSIPNHEKSSGCLLDKESPGSERANIPQEREQQSQIFDAAAACDRSKYMLGDLANTRLPIYIALSEGIGH